MGPVFSILIVKILSKDLFKYNRYDDRGYGRGGYDYGGPSPPDSGFGGQRRPQQPHFGGFGGRGDNFGMY